MDEEKLEGVKVFSFKQGLEEFVDKVFHKCDYYKQNKDDIVSLVEMEICTLSKVFLRSAGSSWSSNIQLERTIHSQSHMDMINLELFMENHEDKPERKISAKTAGGMGQTQGSQAQTGSFSPKPKLSQREQYLKQKAAQSSPRPTESQRPQSSLVPSGSFNFAAPPKTTQQQHFPLDDSPYSNGGVLKFNHETNSGYIQKVLTVLIRLFCWEFRVQFFKTIFYLKNRRS